ncbi:MAG: hypothetical protein IJT14_02865, partial [Rickettsiales bacterium]|nr:hypothetical protein [Rickettsiales bacterium]
LNFASSLIFKKSFTLIELSIVLLILSLLVGSLLVGRQIVDRAKIQRIIFEFDYYEKAFHQFYDTYRVVPGNLDEKTCRKYTEFTSDGVARCDYNASYGHYGIISRIHNQKINGSYNSIRPFSTTMHMLLLAKLIEKWDNYKLTFYESDAIPIEYKDSNAYLTQIGYMQSLFPSSSFDKKIYISFLGWKKVGDNITKTSGARNYLNHNTTNELYNNVFYQSLDNHNAIMFKYLNSDIGSGATRKSSNKSALPSKLASEFDAKIDDGRPGSGKFLAFHMVDDPKYCYDKTSAEVHLAIYNSDTNSAYGCNIIKVMEDVK